MQAMITVERSIEVDRPPAEVFEFLANSSDWRGPRVKAVRSLDAGPPSVGSRYENDLQIGPMTVTVVNELLTYDPPNSLSWTQREGRGVVRTIEGNLKVEATAAGGSKVTILNYYEPLGRYRFLGPALKRALARTIEGQLENARREMSLEAAPAASGLDEPDQDADGGD